VADWFLERWPRIERLGLKFTGGYITFLGVVVVGGLYVNSQQFRPGQRGVLAPSDAWIVYGIGFALLIAGVATWHRRRRDLATATLAGVFAAILGFALPQTQSATVRERAPLLLGVIAVGLYCIRLFGGAYIPVPEPTREPRPYRLQMTAPRTGTLPRGWSGAHPRSTDRARSAARPPSYLKRLSGAYDGSDRATRSAPDLRGMETPTRGGVRWAAWDSLEPPIRGGAWRSGR
jgi:hypothetical protein